AKTYTDFNPITHVGKWDAPILIFQGGKDYRVPIGQGLAAFQAAQLKNIKSRLVYLPEANHWVLSCHNAFVWQREFFVWLKEKLYYLWRIFFSDNTETYIPSWALLYVFN